MAPTLVAALCLLLAAFGRPAGALTYANQTAALLAFKASMLPLGPNWATALKVGGRGGWRQRERPKQLPTAASVQPGRHRGQVFFFVFPADLELPHRQHQQPRRLM